MPLLDLPTELLEHIVILTIADTSFEKFALSCQTTYAVSAQYLAEYKNSRLLKNVAYKTDGPLYTDIQLLLMLIANPSLGRYVKKASLAVNEFHFDSFETFWKTAARFGDGSTLTTIRQFLDSTSSIDNPLKAQLRRALGKFHERHPGLDEDDLSNARGETYWDDYYPENDEYWHQAGVLPTLIMLALMPNLETLKPPREWDRLDNEWREMGEAEILDNVVDTLVRSTNEGTHSSLPCQLKTIEAMRYVTDHDTRPSLATLMPFMALKSVEVMKAELYIGDREDLGFEWRYPGITSNLRVLELHDCRIDGEIEKVLENTPRLEVLRYSHNAWGAEPGWDSESFLSAVCTHLGNTLQELAIASCPDHEWNLREIVVLKGLNALVKAELDINLFQQNGQRSRHRYNQGETPLNLANIMPSSLKELDLCVNARYSLDAQQAVTTVKTLFALGSEEKTELAECRFTVKQDLGEDEDDLWSKDWPTITGERSVWSVVNDAGGKIVHYDGLQSWQK